jgi:hypothetical protein
MTGPTPQRRAKRRAGAALAFACVALAGCGTPAVIKPVHDPLPGFKRDIQAAHSAVSAAERQAQEQDPSAATTP